MSAERDKRTVTDTVILDYAQRSAQNIVVIGVKGGCFVLDDGSLVEVVAAPQPLIEARAGDVAGLARLAWHFGDRHVPIEMLPNRIRVRREPAIEALFTSLGAKLAIIEAPFEPEGGAYTSAHAHDHDHRHGHGHHHQDH